MRNVVSMTAAAAVTLGLISAAWAATAPAPGKDATPGQAVNNHSSRSNREPDEGMAAPVPAAGVQIRLSAVGGWSRFVANQNANAQGAASFANLAPGEYALRIHPAQTPSGLILGAELSRNALIACNKPVESDGARLCPNVTVQGNGPQTLTVQLLGAASTSGKPAPGTR